MEVPTLLGKLDVRGAEHGQCGICGVLTKLTVDHIPPKGAARLTQTEMMHLVHVLAAERPAKGSRFSQNGVKFRSLCAQCNNERLGRDTDPDLIAFSHQIHTLLTSQIVLPRRLTLRLRPQRLIRSVVGHALAYGINRMPDGPFEKALAEYFLDASLSTPAGFDCFYWIYPYNDQVVVRDAVLMDTRLSEADHVVFKLLKFYPISFFLTWNRPSAYDYKFENLCRFGRFGFNDEAEIVVDLSSLPPKRWPEVAPINNSSLVLHGGQAMYAQPYMPKR